MRLKFANSGFTLVEMIIVIFICGILSLGIISLYIMQSHLTSNEINQAQANADLGAGLDLLTPYLFDSKAVLQSAMINGTTYSSGPHVLVLSLPSIDINKNIIANTYDTAVITKSGTNLVMIISPAAASVRQAKTRVVASKITSLDLTYQNLSMLTSTWVKISLSRMVTLSKGSTTVSLAKQFYFRNQ